MDPASFSSRLQEAIVSYMGEGELPLSSSETPLNSTLTSEAPMLIQVLGTVLDTYLVCETSLGLGLIDQHAAHERLIFEQVTLDFERGKVETQQLLLPEVVELTTKESALLEPYLPALNQVGISISAFGASSYMVDALPTYIQTPSVKDLVREMIDEIESWESVSTATKMRERLAAMISCKAAVKAHDKLKPAEMEKLANQVFASLLNKTCPHGRPILIHMTSDDLAREFKRK